MLYSHHLATPASDWEPTLSQQSRFTLHPEGHFTDDSRHYRAADGSFYKLQFSPVLNSGEAAQHAKAITLAAACDIDPANGPWALPTVEELASLVDYTRTYPALAPEIAGELEGGWFWSATPHASASSYAWGVYFYAYNAAKARYRRAVRRVAVPASQ